ncbi:hypothetical protein I79_002909 [Cricetulus griseus]|uniref:Uncharacterized protein n=1 Tax=Cricetulus griseus TaxID=10029 RepID=G3GYT1_CRIGR|nr:hypothetical protein I79_002909 [Cricetulus griseus]
MSRTVGTKRAQRLWARPVCLRNRFKAEIPFLFEQQKGEREPSLFLVSASLSRRRMLWRRYACRLSVGGSCQKHLWLEKSLAPISSSTLRPRLSNIII